MWLLIACIVTAFLTLSDDIACSSLGKFTCLAQILRLARGCLGLKLLKTFNIRLYVNLAVISSNIVRLFISLHGIANVDRLIRKVKLMIVFYLWGIEILLHSLLLSDWKLWCLPRFYCAIKIWPVLFEYRGQYYRETNVCLKVLLFNWIILSLLAYNIIIRHR